LEEKTVNENKTLGEIDREKLDKKFIKNKSDKLN